MFRPSVCRIVIGKDRTFCRFPRKNPYGARRNGLSSTAGPRGFESPFLQRGYRRLHSYSGRSATSKTQWLGPNSSQRPKYC